MKERPLLLLLLLLLCANCTKETTAEEHLVVDGWIENGVQPVIVVSRSIVLGKQEKWNMDDMSASVVRGAEVTLSDGERSVVLTGIDNEDYFPPYVYTTMGFRGEPGKTYTLTVHYGKTTLSARAMLPAQVALNRIWAEPIEDEGYVIHCRFTPRKGEYYGFFTRREGTEKMFLPAFMSLIDGDAASSEVDMVLSSGMDITSSSRHKMFFAPGEKITVRFCSMDKQVYRFWKAYQDAWLQTHNPFFPVSSDVPSNVTGGYGLWAGYASSYYEVVIP